MTKTQLKRIVYDGANPNARRLADWWDEHQEEDRKRIAKEAENVNKMAIREIALAKLTDIEKKALGLL